MKIILAGYNLDYGAISAFKAEHQDMDCLTPETIAAAYARISRDPRPVNELREIAMTEVEKSRQSNRNIVFAMGHSSIAEHALFNIDVLGVSRLLVEDIERSRLASFTEKSQRYVLLEDDFVVPREITDAGCESDFVSTIREQNLFYHKFYECLRSYVFEKHRDLAADQKNRSLLEGWAKEDARYVISLATETQLGMTLNARSMELMIRRLAASPLSEGREFSRRLYEVAGHIAPSLVRYIEPTDYDKLTGRDLREQAQRVGKWECIRPQADEDVVLVHATPDADDKIVAVLLHSSSDISLRQCLEIAASMTLKEKEAVVKTACRRMRSYDSVLREFENVDLHFELTVSATCFAQLKRHRMATITCQDYNPALGATVPAAVSEAGMEQDFRDIISRTEEAYGRIKKSAPEAADYVLTNAHRRRVSMKVNARELYHIARLRCDQYAQWDIRQTAAKMTEAGRKVMPLTLMLASGKDDFNRLYDKVFNPA
ncbi:MAG: FAD-dependent thymidylate synthase [Syntrophales bacterium]|nr:FAD-dependent thymidylate synthase [Syntrophales bacterium]